MPHAHDVGILSDGGFDHGFPQVVDLVERVMRMVAADRRKPSTAAGSKNCCRLRQGESQRLT